MENIEKLTVDQKKKALDVEKALLVIKDVIHKKSVNLMRIVLNYNSLKELTGIISAKIEADLINNSGILTKHQFDISPEQKDKLRVNVKNIIRSSINEYSTSIDNEERSKDILDGIQGILRNIVDYAFGTVSSEINRGLLVPCDVVKVDSKNAKINSMEATYDKNHNVSVPCKAMVMSADTVNVLKKAMLLRDEEFNFKEGKFKSDIKLKK